jgi:hypothetical protein
LVYFFRFGLFGPRKPGSPGYESHLHLPTCTPEACSLHTLHKVCSLVVRR